MTNRRALYYYKYEVSRILDFKGQADEKLNFDG